MKYGLTRRVSSDGTFVEITSEEYTHISNAVSALFHALYIEEKFDVVLQNYAEFELELLSEGLHDMLFQTFDWSDSIARIHVINRRMQNLLSTCRSYLDQAPHHINEIQGKNSSAIVAFDDERKWQYDEHLGYRVMEAIRNYSQHRDFPITRLTRHQGRTSISSEDRRRWVVVPQLDTEAIGRDRKKFKAEVLDELFLLRNEDVPNSQYIDLRPFLRKYISGLGAIHYKVRGELKESLETCDETRLSAVNKFLAQSGSLDLIGLTAVKQSEEGKRIGYEVLFDDMINRRKLLADKNRHLTNYENRYVSNEIAPDV